MATRTPETKRGQQLRARMGANRWARVVEEALTRAATFESVLDHHRESGDSWRASVAVVAPKVAWSTFVRWKRRYERGEGPARERQRILAYRFKHGPIAPWGLAYEVQQRLMLRAHPSWRQARRHRLNALAHSFQ